MAKYLDKIWNDINFLGINDSMSALEKKRTSIYNQLLVIIFTFGLLTSVIQLLAFQSVIKFFGGLIGCIVIGILLFFNKNLVLHSL